ncbi:hypothetical protein, partial [Escherichia coli]|uniref:hypothetical protein n=1 Tax=Escherichia coli TaxID=562 RepID=UPI0019537B0F
GRWSSIALAMGSGEYLDWNRFIEKLWEFQGVTPEMLRRQRDQVAAIQSLARLADDEGALLE